MNKSRAGCNNCTCSPGLLSRNNRRSSLMARQINLKRTGSASGSRPGSRKGSIFTIDASTLCEPSTKETNTSKRLEKLRKQMEEYNLGVYIIPTEDEHQSEYVSTIDQKRGFISGFQGSAGIAIVTRDVTCMNSTPEGLATLSTDGRYFNQAMNELDFNWTLLRQGAVNEPNWKDWSVDQAIQLSIDSGSKIYIGVDPKLITYSLYKELNKVVNDKLVKQPKAEVEIAPIKENLVENIWSEFEPLPPAPTGLIKSLDIKYTGESIDSKLNRLVEKIKQNNGDSLIVSGLDEVAWLLNLRGSDIAFNPLFYAYLIVNKDKKVTLFVDEARFDEGVDDILKQNNISIKPYKSFWDNIYSISKDYSLDDKVFLVTQNVSWELIRNLKCSFTELSRSPIEDFKSIKNPVELKGAISSHLKDGRALCKYFAWLEDQLINKGEILNEVNADYKLTEFRQQEKDFMGLSFATISASGPNAAVIHYHPTPSNNSKINPDEIYLNDSGSHFLDGTTDTTRTIHLGKPQKQEILHYTLVLKANLALSQLKFPENTLGSQIDAISRQHLWKYQVDYGHGTSHGIGSFLNVHEGPMSIGLRPTASASYIKPGQVLSNEPGYYEDGEYGIRIENVMYVKETGQSYNGKKFLQFDTITRVPYCTRLIDTSLLTKEEKTWINDYHKQVWNEISPSFAKNSVEYNWLLRETKAL